MLTTKDFILRKPNKKIELLNKVHCCKSGLYKSRKTHFFFALAASEAFVCNTNGRNKYVRSGLPSRKHQTILRNQLTFFTPRIFLALFFLSFICFLDFSTLVSSPFCHGKIIKNQCIYTEKSTVNT